ncbi:MAG: lysophospholipid acyltransferase family protein [Planctomycetota bacterium]
MSEAGGDADRRERRRRKARRVAAAATPLLKLLAATCRCTKTGLEARDAALGDPRGALAACFHHSILPLTFVHREHDVRVLISRHGDGELIAEAARRFGYGSVRGSTSRGAAQALRELMRVPRGIPIVVTPDGPRGPKGSVQQGSIWLAAGTGRLLLPIGIAVSRMWEARSWDRLRVPRPFARIHVHYADPQAVPRELGRDDLAAWQERLRAALDGAEKCAWDALGKGLPASSNREVEAVPRRAADGAEGRR